jgi:hypothetical protein
MAARGNHPLFCAFLLLITPVVSAAAQQAPVARTGSIAGRIITPDGIPQPDADVVAVTRGPDGRLRHSRWHAHSAFDGRYEIAGLPPGRYLVLVRVVGADSAAEGRNQETLYPGVAVSEPGAPVDVFAGVPTEGIDIWMQPEPRRFQLAGRAVDPKGRAIDHLVVEFGRPWGRASDVSTVSEPGGVFTLDKVTPGAIVMRARAESSGGPLVGVAASTLAIEFAQDVRIALQEPGRVRGQVVAARGADLPSSLEVALVPTLLRPSALYPAEPATVAADGRFDAVGTLGEHEVEIRGLPAGWRVQRLLHQGARVESGRIWLAPGATLTDVRVEVGR